MYQSLPPYVSIINIISANRTVSKDSRSEIRLLGFPMNRAVSLIWTTSSNSCPVVQSGVKDQTRCITLEWKNVMAQDISFWIITCKHNVWMHKFKCSFRGRYMDMR